MTDRGRPPKEVRIASRLAELVVSGKAAQADQLAREILQKNGQKGGA